MKNIPDIFINPEHQKEFDTKGYVKIQFLDTEQITYLDKLFDENYKELPTEGFHSASYLGDFNLKKKMSEEIVKTFSKSYEKIFTNYTAFGGSFLYKMPSENSDLVMHQDWSIVDEKKAVAINCWVPLCDTNKKNGTLMVLPGAHNGNFFVHRAPTLDFFFKGNEKTVMKHLVPMNAKAGEAVILNQSLVHYSPPNVSGTIRKAITAGIKTKDEPMHFYYKDKSKNEDKLELYKMEEDFLISFDNFFEDIFQKPKNGVFVKTIDYKLPQFSDEAFGVLMKKIQGISGVEKNINMSFMEKIKQSVLRFLPAQE